MFLPVLVAFDEMRDASTELKPRQTPWRDKRSTSEHGFQCGGPVHRSLRLQEMDDGKSLFARTWVRQRGCGFGSGARSGSGPQQDLFLVRWLRYWGAACIRGHLCSVLSLFWFACVVFSAADKSMRSHPPTCFKFRITPRRATFGAPRLPSRWPSSTSLARRSLKRCLLKRWIRGPLVEGPASTICHFRT